VCIGEKQLALHLGGETLAIAFAVPLMAYFALHRALPPWARLGAAGVGLFTLFVDGRLIHAYHNQTPGWWGR
jgi:hypothetical protein